MAPTPPSSTSPLRVILILGMVGFGAFAVLVLLIAAVTLLGRNAESTFEPVGGTVPGYGVPTTVPYVEPASPAEAVANACYRAKAFEPVADDEFAPLSPGGVGQVGQIIQLDNGVIGDGGSDWLGTVDLASGEVTHDDPAIDLAAPVVVCAWSTPDEADQEPLLCTYQTTRNDGVVIEVEQEWYQESLTIQVYELGNGDLLKETVVSTFDHICPESMSPDRTNWAPAPYGVVEQWAAEHIADGKVD